MKNIERPYLILAAITGVFALSIQLLLILLRVPGNPAAGYISEVIRFISYMTVLSNLLVTIYFFRKLKYRKSFSEPNASSVGAALFVYMAVVFAIYHTVLAKLWTPQGWQWVADFLLHTVMPLLYFIYWFVFPAKARIRSGHILIWLCFPLLYLVYAMTRGAITGLYPYPFLDLNIHTVSKVIINSVLVTAGYCLLSLFILYLNNCFAYKRAD